MWQDGGVTPDEAREAVQRQRSAVDEANATAQQARAEFYSLLADVQDSGVLRLSELAKLAGYNREHLRRIRINERPRGQE